MRCAPLLFGLVLLATPAHAGPRSEYVTMVLQAFAAKVECPGTDVVYQDLVQKAQEMQQPDGTTEQVRKAIAYMHTGGKMGERAGRRADAGGRHRDEDDGPRPEASRHDDLVRDPEGQACRLHPRQELAPVSRDGGAAGSPSRLAHALTAHRLR